jgi:hypothetical protein
MNPFRLQLHYKGEPQYGADVPVNSAVVNMIHEIELKKRGISIQNFNDPVFNKFD